MYTVENEGRGAPGAPAEERRGAHRASKGAEWKQVAARWAWPGWMEEWRRRRRKKKEKRKKKLKTKSFSTI